MRRCFKCQGLGHITSECPNRKVVEIVKYEFLDDKKDLVDDQEVDEEEEVTYANQGLSIVVQCNFRVACEESEEDWLRTNVFYTRCTTKGGTCLVIIDSGSFENVVFKEIVDKLALKIIPHPSLYKLC